MGLSSAVMTSKLDPRDVPIKAAATVMAVRNVDGGGVEVFMLQRTGRAAFGAGMYVFPGGRVDDVDGATELEPYCSGMTDAEASAQMGLKAGGLAFWVAAVRECFEEAGILIALRRDGSAPAVDDEARHAVHDGTLSMLELCQQNDLLLDLTSTEYVDHWVTPAGEQRRFDTRFFVTRAPQDQDGVHDDKETVDSLWVRPTVALEMAEAGELQVMPPTVANLKWLAQYTTADGALAAAAARTQVAPILPKLRFDAEGAITGISLPTDDDYDLIALDDPHYASLDWVE